MSTERTEMFVLRNIHGGSMKYTAHFVNDILTHVSRKGKTLSRGKDLYTGKDYAFAADVYGKPHTVDVKARKEVAQLRRQTRRTDKTFTGLKQKRPGGRPSVKARPKDVGKKVRQERYEAIIRRIRGIRDCARKEAQKIYKHYLPTICAGAPPESHSPHVVKISRAIVNPDNTITWLYLDEQSPKYLFEPDPEVENNLTFLRAVSPVRVLYEWLIKELPSPETLEIMWSESTSFRGKPLINTDFMSYYGVGADEDVQLTKTYKR